MKYNCLIVDDEKVLADSTAEYFELFGVKTYVAYGADDCRRFFSDNRTEIILLDINLGDGSGFDLCKTLRGITDVPILFISARASDDDKIVALSIGGDDYVQKPYSLAVLLAKVKAVLKRCGSARINEYGDGYLSVNMRTKQVTAGGRELKLTSLEFRLLAYLIENEGRVVSKRELFENVWKDKFTSDGTLNVHIRRLREAIERTREPKYIVTVWGDGYKFTGGKA